MREKIKQILQDSTAMVGYNFDKEINKILTILPDKNRWVSVRDKSPEGETKNCSVGCNFKDKDGAVYQGYCDWLYEELEWYSYEHRGYIDDITHWMLLPGEEL